jgi:hypothetical protein
MSHSEHRDALDRLLGPSDRELGCDECFEELDKFVELELAGVDAEARVPGMRAHLEGCAACREDHGALYELVAEDVAGA